MAELCADRREMERFVTQANEQLTHAITGLEQLEGAVKQLVYCEAFQGVEARHIKSYYEEFHLGILGELKVAARQLKKEQTHALTQFTKEVEEHEKAYISGEYLKELKKAFQTRQEEIHEIHTELAKSLKDIQEIAVLPLPSMKELDQVYGELIGGGTSGKETGKIGSMKKELETFDREMSKQIKRGEGAKRLASLEKKLDKNLANKQVAPAKPNRYTREEVWKLKVPKEVSYEEPKEPSDVERFFLHAGKGLDEAADAVANTAKEVLHSMDAFKDTTVQRVEAFGTEVSKVVFDFRENTEELIKEAGKLVNTVYSGAGYVYAKIREITEGKIVWKGMLWLGDKGYDVLEEIGNGIGEAGIPLLSDFTIGVFGKEGGESSFARTVGSFVGGIWIDGLGGLTKGVLEVAANPNETMEGILETAFHPVEAWESFTKGIEEYVDETIVNGTSEDRGRVVGQLAFEALTWMIGVGEVKAATGACKGLQKGIKITTKLKGTTAKIGKKTLGKSKINGKLFQEKLESIVKRVKNQRGKMGEKLKKNVGVEEVGKKGSKGAGGAKVVESFKETAQSKVSQIREKLPTSKLRNQGNMAVADVDIKGLPKEYVAHSKIHSPSSTGSDVANFSHTQPNKRFKTYVEDKFPRYNDTEVKILEDIATKITPETKGTINLYTELPACQSCSNVILEFRREFPGIKLNIFTE